MSVSLKHLFLLTLVCVGVGRSQAASQVWDVQQDEESLSYAYGMLGLDLRFDSAPRVHAEQVPSLEHAREDLYIEEGSTEEEDAEATQVAFSDYVSDAIWFDFNGPALTLAADTASKSSLLDWQPQTRRCRLHLLYGVLII